MPSSSGVVALVWVAGLLFITQPLPTAAWDLDLELFDLVEEIPQTFYEFMSVSQDATSSEIKKAYRRLSLILHPDKNKDENAETQFRQLVAIYEVLKDEERRQRYDDILVNGLPDWRQPMFYYRRVRKMSNGELGFLLFLILTVGHYAVIWSIYLEKQLDELLSKKKKEKKKKQSSKVVEEVKTTGQEKNERSDKPHWHDILPLKLSIWLYYSLKSLPHVIQDVKQYYKDYKEMKVKEKEEAEALAEQESQQREKRPKVKKPKMEFPVYEPSEAAYVPFSVKILTYKQEEDVSLLTRNMAKFPGGTPGRWEKIAHELGRSVTEVTAKVKQIKEGVSSTPGLVKFSELKSCATVGKGSVPDSLMTQREELESPAPSEPDAEGDSENRTIRRRAKKSAAGPAGAGEERVKGRRQKDFDPTAVDEDSEDEKKSSPAAPPKEKPSASDDVWTQNQQRLLELALQQYPRGTAERWDRIAKVVPGKSKEECMIRYKLLAELVQRRKQAKS
uniref:DnaJ homolog subfamily C member 1 n=1 Tax=Pygocentrus nattereri TaxID=42514 RepID=A0A3B4E0N6_PYGNA